MNWKSKYIPLAILLVSILIAVLVIVTRPTVEKVAPEIPHKIVRVQTVEKENTGMIVKSQGSVAPRTEIMLVSEVAGRAVSVSPSFVAGGFFGKGKTLLTVDPSNYELAVTQAKSQVAQAERIYQMEEQQGKIAREEWQRLNKGEIPPLVAREPQLNEARAALDAAKANLKKAELDLQRTRISAPFIGRVRSKAVDIGQYVAPGNPIGSVYAVDYAEVRLPIPDEALAYIDMPYSIEAMKDIQGPRVVLSARFAGKTHQWEGYLTRIEGEIDPQSRMIYVVARVKDPYGLNKTGKHVPLTVGLFVTAEIHGKTIADVIRVPRSALRNGNQVLIVDQENKLHFRTVNIIRQAGDDAYIDDGLKNGERICISTLSAAVEGMTVAIADESVPEKTSQVLNGEESK